MFFGSSFIFSNVVVICMLWQRVLVRGWTATPTQWQHLIRRRGTVRLASSTSTTTPTTTSTYDELVAIAAELRRHDDLYYNQATPIVDDATYDALAAREAALLRAHPAWLARIRAEEGGVTATRWQGRVGAAAVDDTDGVNGAATTEVEENGPINADTGRVSRSHAVPMLSLDNVYDSEQLVQWIGRVSKRILAAEGKANETVPVDPTVTSSSVAIISEPKLDGLSLSIRYEKKLGTSWELQWAATRGDGRKGTDVTEAVRSMTTMIPPTLPMSFEEEEEEITFLEVRGEVILPVAAWKHNATNLTNARNAASGILLRKTSNAEDSDLRSQLEFYAYDLVVGSATNNRTATTENGYEMRQQLHSMGFSTPEPHLLTTVPLHPNASDIQTILQYQQEQQTNQSSSSTSTSSSLLQCDGCVHKLQTHRAVVGTSTRAPRWAVAYKFATTVTGTTRLLHITTQVGRTGVLTPVAVLEPVVLDGVTVQRATLHHFRHAQSVFHGDTNASESSSSSVPVGTIVTVRRAGDVIPQILTATIVANPKAPVLSLTPPTHCPACGAPTVCTESSTRCNNPIAWDCPPRAVAGLQHAFGRDALDLKGLSGARLEQLRNASLVRWPGDVWTIARDPDQRAEWLALEGWGETSVTKLCTAAEHLAQHGVSLPRYLRALNIPLAGTHASQLLADMYGTVEAFLHDLREANFDRLADDSVATKGIGPLLIASLVEYAGSTENVQAAEDLADKILVLKAEGGDATRKSPTEGPFANLSVVFTGTLPNGMKRPEAQELAKQLLGAKSTPTSVSKTTGLVVVGQRGGKKQKQAEEYGIRIMPAEDFVALVEEQKRD